RAVGIARLLKVRPVGAHRLRQGFVSRRWRGPIVFPELMEHIREFLGVWRAVPGSWRVGRERLVEVIQEHLRLAGLVLETGPRQGVPTNMVSRVRSRAVLFSAAVSPPG